MSSAHCSVSLACCDSVYDVLLRLSHPSLHTLTFLEKNFGQIHSGGESHVQHAHTKTKNTKKKDKKEDVTIISKPQSQGTRVTSDVVKVKGEDPAIPGPLKRNDPGTVTNPQYRVKKT